MKGFILVSALSLGFAPGLTGGYKKPDKASSQPLTVSGSRNQLSQDCWNNSYETGEVIIGRDADSVFPEDNLDGITITTKGFFGISFLFEEDIQFFFSDHPRPFGLVMDYHKDGTRQIADFRFQGYHLIDGFHPEEKQSYRLSRINAKYFPGVASWMLRENSLGILSIMTLVLEGPMTVDRIVLDYDDTSHPIGNIVLNETPQDLSGLTKENTGPIGKERVYDTFDNPVLQGISDYHHCIPEAYFLHRFPINVPWDQAELIDKDRYYQRAKTSAVGETFELVLRAKDITKRFGCITFILTVKDVSDPMVMPVTQFPYCLTVETELLKSADIFGQRYFRVSDNSGRVTMEFYDIDGDKLLRPRQGIQTVSFTVTDAFGNTAYYPIRIACQDVNPPEILLSFSDITIAKDTLLSEERLLEFAIGYDEEDGRIKDIIIVEDDYMGNYDLPGDYQVVFACQDSSGNECRKPLRIHVVNDLSSCWFSNSAWFCFSQGAIPSEDDLIALLLIAKAIPGEDFVSYTQLMGTAFGQDLDCGTYALTYQIQDREGREYLLDITVQIVPTDTTSASSPIGFVNDLVNYFHRFWQDLLNLFRHK